jgi:RNA polymerase sigma-70 factor (ECF subfamily)
MVYSDYIKTENPSFYCNTDKYLLHSELEGRLEQALCKLPSEVSEVFRMNRFGGYKYNEIANMLGVSVRTVEVRIGKALHFLRCNLKEYLTFLLIICTLIISIPL